MRNLKIAAVIGMAFFIGSESLAISWLEDKNVIFRKGPDTWVKLAKANKKQGPLDHPREFTADQIKGVLLSIRYFKPGMLSFTGNKGKELDLFTMEEVDLLTEHLAAAFLRVDEKQWVDFSMNAFRGQSFVGTHRLSDGVMFVKNGKLNIAFRNIAAKNSPDSEVNTYDPTRGYRAFNKLIAGDGHELIEENWLAMDVKNLPKLEAPVVAPVPVAPVVVTPAPSTPAPAAPQPAPAAPAQASVKERLRELQQIYDEGLITEAEYEKKRKEILDDL